MPRFLLITGVSSGIGHHAVGHFVERGYQVFGSVRSSADLDRLHSEFPNRFTGLQFDVTHQEEIQGSVSQVRRVIGRHRLAGLVNNAGYAVGGPMELLSDRAFRDQIEVNLFGIRNVTNAFLPVLGTDKSRRGAPGRIIMISSISVIFNTPMNGAYCVSKHALESLAEIYRRELSMYGVRVSSIQPGPIQSDLWGKNLGSLAEYAESDYGPMAAAAEQLMRAAARDALPAAVISDLIERILTVRKPRRSYVVNRRLLMTLLFTKMAPAGVVDYLLGRRFNLKPAS